MIVIGLTGSLAMGKSTLVRQLRSLGLPVFDCDAYVHQLLAADPETIAALSRLIPDAVEEGRIDRARLGRLVFYDKKQLRRLEALLHPKVFKAMRAFIREARLKGAAFVVLDVPLLFETGAERLCDVVFVVSAPPWVQRRRALARPGMDPARLRALLELQVADHEKRRRADLVITSGLTPAKTFLQLKAALKRLER